MEDQFGNTLKDRGAWRKQHMLVSQLRIFVCIFPNIHTILSILWGSLTNTWHLHVLGFDYFLWKTQQKNTCEPTSQPIKTPLAVYLIVGDSSSWRYTLWSCLQHCLRGLLNEFFVWFYDKNGSVFGLPKSVRFATKLDFLLCIFSKLTQFTRPSLWPLTLNKVLAWNIINV